MTVPTPPVENPQSITVVTSGTNIPAQTFTAADLERVRTQEKEKLYKELDALREQTASLPTVTAELENLRKEREERTEREAAAKAAADQEAKLRAEAEMSAKELSDKRQAEWQEQFDRLQAERDTERAALDKEREFARLRDYTQGRIAQEQKLIAPELLDLVDGNSTAEIDASIERLKAKSAAIAEKIRGSQQQLAAQQQGVTSAGFSTTGPMDMISGTETYTAEDIAKMSMKDYVAKLRDKVIHSDARERGLYG